MLLDVLNGGSFTWIDIVSSIVSSLIVIFVCLPFHEFAHAFIAVKLGDHTPKAYGRVTLNPFAHIDYLGALLILAVGFGYAKPVPVNPFRFKRPKIGLALVSFAGPLANVLMAFVLLLLSHIVALFGYSQIIVIIITILYYAARINVCLAVFNLIPVPPLDGSKILMAFTPNKFNYYFQRYEKYLYFALFAIIAFGVLDKPIYFATNAIMEVLSTVVDLPFRLFR